jgi:hypothetical protein
MQVHIVSEVPYPPFACDGGENLEPIESGPTLALFRAFTLLVSPSPTGQTSTSSPELRRLTLRVVFSPHRFKAVPDVQALECRYTHFEAEIRALLRGWR